KRFFVVTFAAGDFNEDGRPDLVVETCEPNPYPDLWPMGAKVFLQQSDGTFKDGNEYLLPTTGITWDFVTGDFNEDGHLDILMEEADHDMLLMLGNGDGTFKDPAFLGLNAAGYFAVADLNGDKHLDFVAGSLDSAAAVFIGNGKGAFTLKTNLETQVT